MILKKYILFIVIIVLTFQLTSCENNNNSIKDERISKVDGQQEVSAGDNGGISENKQILKDNECWEEMSISDFFSKQLPVAIILLFIFFTIMSLITFFYMRAEKLLFFNSLSMLLFVIYITTRYIPTSLLSESYNNSLKNAIAHLLFITLIMVTQAMYRVYLSECNRIVVPVVIMVSVVTFFCNFTLYDILFARLITSVSLFFYFPYCIFLLKKLQKIKPDTGKLRFLTMVMIISFMIILSELATAYAGWKVPIRVLTYTSPIFIPIFAIPFAKEIIKTRIEIGFLYSKLRKLEKNDKELSISETSEVKLKRIIDFIGDNYSSDISREGLASAVGMNANYMGSLFKSYTGKKIKEYINELRIKDAINQLTNTDGKIIDIAFSVGFESHVTFNRVFKSSIGKTPSRFRKEHVNSN